MINRNTLQMAGGFIVSVALLSGCAAPQVTGDFTSAGNAIRAAEIAGAATYAYREFEAANQNHRKAEKLLRNGRLERAEILLELASAQADLATAISEAEYAEESLRNMQSVIAQ